LNSLFSRAANAIRLVDHKIEPPGINPAHARDHRVQTSFERFVVNKPIENGSITTKISK
jgi:hypothetical protein